MTVADDLRAVLDTLRRDGWQQHKIGTKNGPKCIHGAGLYAIIGDAEVPVTHEHAGRILDVEDAIRRAGGISVSLTSWNDVFWQTKDRVIATVERAIELEEGR